MGVFGSMVKLARSVGSSPLHKAGMQGAGELVGLGQSKGLLKAVGVGFGGYAAISGYQHGGLSGMAGELASEAASWYAFGAMTPILSAAAVTAAGAAAFTGVGMAAAGWQPQKILSRPYVNDYMRRHAKLEMGTPAMDQFGTIATMRQRSIQAIQNSRISGRGALGNEASMFHRSVY